MTLRTVDSLSSERPVETEYCVLTIWIDIRTFFWYINKMKGGYDHLRNSWSMPAEHFSGCVAFPTRLFISRAQQIIQ